MRTLLRYVFVISITLAVVGAGILLPSRIAGLQDAQIIGRMEFEPMEMIAAGYRPQLSIMEKIRLMDVENRDTIAIPLNQGREMDETEAIDACAGEIETLGRAGILPELNAAADNIFPVAVNYYMSVVSPSRYVILWTLAAKINNVYGEFYLDEETGKILGLTIETAEAMPVTLTPEETAAAWGDYLDLDLLNIESVSGRELKDKITIQYFFAVYQFGDETMKYPITISEIDRVFGAIMPPMRDYQDAGLYSERSSY